MHAARTLAAGVVLGLVLSAVPPALAAPRGWTDSLKKAREAAKKLDRPILVDFTGSNWCGWCMKLRQEVFSSSEFERWAKTNVVLLELDFPRPDNQADWIKRQNAAMMTKYGVSGFPTVLLIEEDGTLIGRTGYMAGGAKNWIANTDLILAKRSGTAAQKPPELKLADSLAKGVGQAKQDGRPLLLIIADKSEELTLAHLVTNEAFVRYANACFVNVHVSPRPTGSDAVLLGHLRTKCELKADSPLIAVLDVETPKALVQADGVPAADKFIARLDKELPPLAYDGGWLDDFDRAAVIARRQSRPILLLLADAKDGETLRKIRSEVLETDAFKDYAKDALVLVGVDGGEGGTAGQRLVKEFGVQGLPKFVVLGPDAKALGRLDFQPGGPAPFIQRLKPMLPKQTARAETPAE